MQARWVMAGLVIVGVALWVLSNDGFAPSTSTPQPVTDDASTTPPTLTGLPDEVAPNEGHLREKRARANARLASVLASPIDRQKCRIVGRVTRADGTPIEDAEVEMTDGDADSGSTDTTVDGRFAVDCELVHPFRVVISAAGHVPWLGGWRRVKDKKLVDLGTIVMEPALTISGRVHEPDGKPPAETVILWFEPDEDPVPEWWSFHAASDNGVVTAADGSFAFDRLPAGRFRILVSRSDVVVERVLAGTTDLRIEVPRPKTRVRRVEKTWVVALEFRTEDEGLVPQLYITGIGGTHHFSGKVPAILGLSLEGEGPVDVLVRPRVVGYAPVILRDLRPTTESRTVVLRRGRTLRGRLNGVPKESLRNAALLFSGVIQKDGTVRSDRSETEGHFGRHAWRVWLGANGTFSAPGMLPGTVDVALRRRSMVLDEASRLVSTDRGNVDLKVIAFPFVDVTFRAPGNVKMTQIDWRVSALRSGGEIEVDREGKSFDDVEFTERVYLHREPCDHVLRAELDNMPEAGPLEVRIPQGTKTLEVTFPANRVISGRVLDPDGKPVVNASVAVKESRDAAMHTDDPNWWATYDRPHARTDIDGSFELCVPDRGTWKLLAVAHGRCMRDAPQRVAPGKAGLTLVMIPSLRIKGRLVGSANGGAVARIVAWPEDGGPGVFTYGDATGFFEIAGLRPGRYVVTARQDTGSYVVGAGRSELVAAGARRVQTPMQRGLTTKLDLFDSAGRRLHGAIVHLRDEYASVRASAGNAGRPFEVHCVVPGAYRFDVMLDDGTTRSIAVEAGQTAKLVIRE